MIIFYSKNIPNLKLNHTAACVKLYYYKSAILAKLYCLYKLYITKCNDVEIKPSDYGWRA